jgi:hypothetical protein
LEDHDEIQLGEVGERCRSRDDPVGLGVGVLCDPGDLDSNRVSLTSRSPQQVAAEHRFGRVEHLEVEISGTPPSQNTAFVGL